MKSLIIFELKKILSFKITTYIFLFLFSLSTIILLLSSIKLGNVSNQSHAQRYFLGIEGYLELFWAMTNLIFPFIIIHHLFLDRNSLKLNLIKYLPITFLDFYLSRTIIVCLFLFSTGIVFGSLLIVKLYYLNIGSISFVSHFVVLKWISYVSMASILYYILIISIFTSSKSPVYTLFFHLLNIFLVTVGSQTWVPINWSKIVIELLWRSN